MQLCRESRPSAFPERPEGGRDARQLQGPLQPLQPLGWQARGAPLCASLTLPCSPPPKPPSSRQASRAPPSTLLSPSSAHVPLPFGGPCLGWSSDPGSRAACVSRCESGAALYLWIWQGKAVGVGGGDSPGAWGEAGTPQGRPGWGKLKAKSTVETSMAPHRSFPSPCTSAVALNPSFAQPGGG